MDIIPLLSACQLGDLKRIDVGLEGDWSPTVEVFWTREAGVLNRSDIVLQHVSYKPSLEVYFENGWIGLHCFRRAAGRNVLDRALLQRIVDAVEAALAAED